MEMRDESQEEQPQRFFVQLGRQMIEVARDERDDHEERMHLPPRRTEPVQAIPFPDERIPDVHLAKILETMQRENCSLEEAAAAWHYPISLVERCMADYEPQWRRYLMRRSSELDWEGK